jgi:hypothetical protein
VNPLTGLKVANAKLLERRPLLVKVSNLPRSIRPQWGLSKTDLVFEYYTEEGGTRFAALFYGQDAPMVGSIRSARFVDLQLIRGYKAVFAFGFAYVRVMDRLLDSEIANRLVVEGTNSPLKRYDPNGADLLVVNTAELSAYATAKGVENGRQNLDGMYFNLPAPAAGGQTVSQIFVRFSGSIYNRWDYDTASGRYLRFVDSADDFDGTNEQYVQLVDRQDNSPIAFDNLVVLQVNNTYYSVDPEVMDIQLVGSGSGWAFRDGQAYPVTWQRQAPEGIVTLANPDGSPYAIKPGRTCFEVIGLASRLQQSSGNWRFVNFMP